MVQNVLPAPDLAALRAKALAQMEEVLAMDRWGGGKGAWTYMFGVQNDRTSMMCAAPYPQRTPSRVQDSMVTRAWAGTTVSGRG